MKSGTRVDGEVMGGDVGRDADGCGGNGDCGSGEFGGRGDAGPAC
jgi:hypothetical protein